MKKTNVAGYSYDITTNTLTVTADFAKKASQINTPEYRIVKQYRAEFPGIAIQRKTNSASHSSKGIKYADMERYMRNCRTADRYLFVFGKVRELSKGQPNPYKYVRTWFDNLFPHYSEQPVIDGEGFIVENPDILALPAPAAVVPAFPMLEKIYA